MENGDGKGRWDLGRYKPPRLPHSVVVKRPACTTLSGSGRGGTRSASHLLAHPRPHPGLSGLRAMHYLLRQAVQASKLPRFQSRLLQGGDTLSETGVLPLESAVLLRERSQQG